MSSRFLIPTPPSRARPRSSRTRPARSSPRPSPARPRASRSRRCVVGEEALGSPRRAPAASFGATSSPFSPSRTTSGTPPTAVAITGHPTASASTTVCGKFSHADGRTEASAARKSRSTVSRGTLAEEAHASVEPELADWRSSAPPLGPVARDRERHAVRLHERLEQDADGLLRAEPAREHEDVALRARARAAAPRAKASAGSSAPGSGAPRPARDRAPSAGRRRAGRRSGRTHAVARLRARRCGSPGGSASATPPVAWNSSSVPT